MQLGSVLTCDDAFIIIDVGRHAVEQGRLARTGASRNYNVAANTANDGEQGTARGGDRAEFHELIERQPITLEFADGERWTLEG